MKTNRERAGDLWGCLWERAIDLRRSHIDHVEAMRIIEQVFDEVDAAARADEIQRCIEVADAVSSRLYAARHDNGEASIHMASGADAVSDALEERKK